MEEKKLTWKELPEGDILEAGTSRNFKTGNWRSTRPLHIPEKCIHCLICWVYCPDSAIKTRMGSSLNLIMTIARGAEYVQMNALKMQ